MKSLGHYTIEIIRNGWTVRISAGGAVALVSALALIWFVANSWPAKVDFPSLIQSAEMQKGS